MTLTTLLEDPASESEMKRLILEVIQTVDIETDDTALKNRMDGIAASIRKEVQNLDSRTASTVDKINDILKQAVSDKQFNVAVERIAARMIEVQNKCSENIEAAVKKIERTAPVPQAPVVFDDAKLKIVADNVFQTLFTKAIAKEVASGELAPLPPLRPVDPYFVENEQTVAIERHVKTKRHAMASGPSGSGKTFPIEQVLRKLGKRYLKVSVADGLSMADFLARPHVRSGKNGTETYFTHGFLPLTMKGNIPLILDEIDQCQPEIVSVLNAAMEDRALYIPQTGETIKAGPEWQVFMTCNTLRDSTGIYQGFRLSGALLNRLVFIKSDYLPVDDEVKILVRVGLTSDDANTIVGVMNGLRAAHMSGKLTAAPSTRLAVRISRMLLGQDDFGNVVDAPVELADAFQSCLLAGLPENEVKEAAAVLDSGI